MLPIAPATTGPAAMPMPMWNCSWPALTSSSFQLRTAPWISIAARTARTGASGWEIGAPKSAIMPSPMNLSRVPSWRKRMSTATPK